MKGFPQLTDADVKEIVGIVNTKLIGMEKVALAMLGAARAGFNVILWGRGGEAKSEIAKIVTEELMRRYYKGELVYELHMSSSTKPAEPFGGVDIKELSTTGNVRYNLPNGFTAAKIARFEEMLDALSPALEGLKNVITNGSVCYGKVCIPIDTCWIVGTTNVDPVKWADEEPSLDAFIKGRFPIWIEVKSDLKPDQMRALMDIAGIKKEFAPTAANLCSFIIKSGKPLTPRELVYIGKIVEANRGTENAACTAALECFSVAADSIARFNREQKALNDITLIELAFEQAYRLNKEAEELSIPVAWVKYMELSKILESIEQTLREVSVHDDISYKFKGAEKHLKNAKEELFRKFTKQLANG